MLEVVDRLEAEFEELEAMLEDERKAHARTREYMRACAQTLFRERRDGPVPGSPGTPGPLLRGAGRTSKSG